MEKKKVKEMLMDENGNFGVYAISFVTDPAIESNFIHLSKHEIKLESIDEERRMVYGAVLIPDKLIPRLDQVTGEEYYIKFSKETIRAAAYAFLKQGNQREHTLQHEIKVAGCTVVESWIKEYEEDKATKLGLDAPIGTWIVGNKVDNDDIWAQVKNGEVKGFSIEGLFDAIENLCSAEQKILSDIERVIDANL
jgi:hypothetical protein